MGILPDSDMDVLAENSQYLFRNISITISVILLITYAVSRVIFPKMFTSVYNFSKFGNFRIKEDFGSNIRLLSTENFYFTAILSASISFVILNIIIYTSDPLQSLSWLIPETLGAGLLIWLLLTISIQVFFLLKYLFMSAFGALFNLPLSISRHYQEMQGLNNCFVLILVGVAAVAVYSNFNFPVGLINVMIMGVLIYLLYRLLNIYIKLDQLKMYSKLYIFSYLCTTEIIPSIIGYKLLF